MNNAANTKATEIETTIQAVYGVGALECDALTVEWAAERVAAKSGTAAAAKGWRKLNRRRQKAGKYTTIPQWGTALFAAYFG